MFQNFNEVGQSFRHFNPRGYNSLSHSSHITKCQNEDTTRLTTGTPQLHSNDFVQSGGYNQIYY